MTRTGAPLSMWPSGESCPATLPGIYVHVPFCSAVCPYCDFAVTRGSSDRRREFVADLEDEIRIARSESERYGAFGTIYFGGGTPSSLAPHDLGRLLDALRDAFACERAWISMEANPEDIDRPRLAAWRGLGVRTISLGVQSFDDLELRRLGRRHRSVDAERAVGLALEAGFDTVALDVIFGLPGQAENAVERTIRRAAGLGVQHVSSYQLTFHENTPYARGLEQGVFTELADDAQHRLFRLVHRELEAAGFAAYEVSNFARGDEHRSAHNEKYWRHLPYLGLGPSAHSFDGGERWWNVRDAADWTAVVRGGSRPVAGRERLSAEELALEHVMLGLRTREGIDLGRFRARFGVDLAGANSAYLADLRTRGCLRDAPGRIALTVDGWAVADAIARELSLDATDVQRREVS